MKRIACLATFALLALSYSTASAQLPSSVSQFLDPDAKGKDEFDIIKIGRRLKGRIVDHTSNHAQDNRIWSRSLNQWRDLYLYLPPNYSKHERYPIMIYMHPFALDERSFLHLVPIIDDAIACGKLPPLIIAAPDGSLDGCGCLAKPGSFFINSNAGPYEDFVFQDVWDFVTNRYPIRTERNCHVLCGVSMGGCAAFNPHPPIATLWHRSLASSATEPALADVDGNPRAKFDPRRWGWAHRLRSARTKSSRNYGGLFKVKLARSSTRVRRRR